jgi:hypothetical protein
MTDNKKFHTRDQINQTLRKRILDHSALKNLDDGDLDEIVDILFRHAFDDHDKDAKKNLTKVIDEISSRIVQGR